MLLFVVFVVAAVTIADLVGVLMRDAWSGAEEVGLWWSSLFIPFGSSTCPDEAFKVSLLS